MEKREMSAAEKTAASIRKANRDSGKHAAGRQPAKDLATKRRTRNKIAKMSRKRNRRCA